MEILGCVACRTAVREEGSQRAPRSLYRCLPQVVQLTLKASSACSLVSIGSLWAHSHPPRACPPTPLACSAQLACRWCTQTSSPSSRLRATWCAAALLCRLFPVSPCTGCIVLTSNFKHCVDLAFRSPGGSPPASALHACRPSTLALRCCAAAFTCSTAARPYPCPAVRLPSPLATCMAMPVPLPRTSHPPRCPCAALLYLTVRCLPLLGSVHLFTWEPTLPRRRTWRPRRATCGAAGAWRWRASACCTWRS